MADLDMKLKQAMINERNYKAMLSFATDQFDNNKPCCTCVTKVITTENTVETSQHRVYPRGSVETSVVIFKKEVNCENLSRNGKK